MSQEVITALNSYILGISSPEKIIRRSDVIRSMIEHCLSSEEYLKKIDDILKI
jgi:hypothetical protein